MKLTGKNQVPVRKQTLHSPVSHYFLTLARESRTRTSESMYSMMKSQTSSIVLGLSSSLFPTGSYFAGSWCSVGSRVLSEMTEYKSLQIRIELSIHDAARQQHYLPIQVASTEFGR